ncbi:hypothetical protein [Actinoplanes sp. NPDC048796]|uniref:hypothetical protein n=1 Tax=Actinoplanes sp. NPDC048796 TaxID=3155640 RepID=UPI0033D831E2
MRPPIAFEPDRTDAVSAVLIPMDGITRRIVRSGVDAQLWDREWDRARPNRLIRNLSGHLVLVNVPPGPDLTFRITADRAGYRGPVFVTYNPAGDGLRRVVPLERRPDASYGDVATLVRGTVGRPDARAPVPGLTVSARLPSPRAGHQFPATTDANGDFALAVGIRTIGIPEPGPVTATLRFAKAGLPARELNVNLEHGRVHVFSAVIDLDGADRPPFVHETP